nr:DUF123 domain-containing protein [Halarchaeum rubridurum]
MLLSLPTPATVTFGAAGERRLDSGWYAYTGSAFGPGGLSRVERHRRVAAGEHDVRHWHVDYLTGHPGTDLDAGEPVPGLGASDCDCETHVTYARERGTLASVATERHGTVR